MTAIKLNLKSIFGGKNASEKTDSEKPKLRVREPYIDPSIAHMSVEERMKDLNKKRIVPLSSDYPDMKLTVSEMDELGLVLKDGKLIFSSSNEECSPNRFGLELSRYRSEKEANEETKTSSAKTNETPVVPIEASQQNSSATSSENTETEGEPHRQTASFDRTESSTSSRSPETEHVRSDRDTTHSSHAPNSDFLEYEEINEGRSGGSGEGGGGGRDKEPPRNSGNAKTSRGKNWPNFIFLFLFIALFATIMFNRQWINTYYFLPILGLIVGFLLVVFGKVNPKVTQKERGEWSRDSGISKRPGWTFFFGAGLLAVSLVILAIKWFIGPDRDLVTVAWIAAAAFLLMSVLSMKKWTGFVWLALLLFVGYYILHQTPKPTWKPITETVGKEDMSEERRVQYQNTIDSLTDSLDRVRERAITERQEIISISGQERDYRLKKANETIETKDKQIDQLTRQISQAGKPAPRKTLLSLGLLLLGIIGAGILFYRLIGRRKKDNAANSKKKWFYDQEIVIPMAFIIIALCGLCYLYLWSRMPTEKKVYTTDPVERMRFSADSLRQARAIDSLQGLLDKARKTTSTSTTVTVDSTEVKKLQDELAEKDKTIAELRKQKTTGTTPPRANNTSKPPGRNKGKGRGAPIQSRKSVLDDTRTQTIPNTNTRRSVLDQPSGKNQKCVTPRIGVAPYY